MNLSKLFEAQKKLREHINYNGEDRFEKLILALLVEIGECANEWRGFKFWSTKQEPLTTCRECEGDGQSFVFAGTSNEQYKPCEVCNGEGEVNYLLEEYVDGLHFILEIGLEIGITDFQPIKMVSFHDKATVGDFTSIYLLASHLDYGMSLLGSGEYKQLFNNYLHLGTMLGFTWEQIEQAYFDKNQINHVRQDEGY